MQISTDRLFAEIGASAGKMAGIISRGDPGLPVPSCPDWTLRQLGTHLGRVHRWAAEIVSTRTAEAIPMKAAPDGIPPADPAGQADWLLAGAQRLTEAIRAAGTDQVWAFGSLAPAAFWARRQAHETMVHRADAELAAGLPVVLDAELAADAVDEWLRLMAGPRYGRPDARATALPAGASLHVIAIAPGQRGTRSGRWLIKRVGDSVEVLLAPKPIGPDVTGPDVTGPDVTGPDVTGPDLIEPSLTVSGPPDQILLMLLRRLSPEAADIRLSGDTALLTGWLAGTPFG
jgi:uncharacterized protein (TIGR03083 family)